jgi:hypothetical protein
VYLVDAELASLRSTCCCMISLAHYRSLEPITRSDVVVIRREMIIIREGNRLHAFRLLRWPSLP